MRVGVKAVAVSLSLALAGCGSADGGPSSSGDPFSSTADVLSREGFSQPAQWEPQESVWTGWWVQPYGGAEFPTENVVIEIVQALTPQLPVNLAVQSAEEETFVRGRLASSGVDVSRVRFRTIAHNDFWFRDTGGIFSRNRAGDLGVIDWGYDSWSYDRYTGDFSQHDERIDRDVAELLSAPAFRCNMIHEGGNTDVDGHGTAIVTETVVRRRNPYMSLPEMERELKRCYGVRQVIFLPDGLVEDQAIQRGILPGGVFNPGGTDGHIDEYVRFAPNNTVLLAEVRGEDISRFDSGERQRALINRQRLEAAYQILSRARDADGRPYRIVRVPMAEPDYYTLTPDVPWYPLYPGLSPLEDGTVIHDGDTLRIVSTTSYLNFFVSNGVVLMPSYAMSIPTALSRRKDAEMTATLLRVFPGRRVVPIRWAVAANRGAGGPHCMTQQQPVAAP